MNLQGASRNESESETFTVPNSKGFWNASKDLDERKQNIVNALRDLNTAVINLLDCDTLAQAEALSEQLEFERRKEALLDSHEAKREKPSSEATVE